MQSVIPISLGMVKVFLIKGEKTILVDTGIKGSFKRIVEGMKNNGVKPEDIALIIATHAHADHVGELKELQRITRAKVAMHRLDAEFFRKGESAEVRPTGIRGKILKSLFVGKPIIEALEPDILVDDEIGLEDYGIKGRIIHTPGHTDGCISIVLSGGEAIVGDMIAGGRGKNGAKTEYPVFATNMDALRKSLKKISGYSPEIIYSSHGAPCSNEAVVSLLKFQK